MPEHDPRCEEIPFADMVKEGDWGTAMVPPDQVQRAIDRGVTIVRCHPDCPNLARVKARGAELAKELGW